jgi:hypothetical protein
MTLELKEDNKLRVYKVGQEKGLRVKGLAFYQKGTRCTRWDNKLKVYKEGQECSCRQLGDAQGQGAACVHSC